MAMDELTRDFLIESQEVLDRMEHCLTDLEERPQDTGLLAEIFRSVHTIKGATGFWGFKRLEKLAHAGENLLGCCARVSWPRTAKPLPDFCANRQHLLLQAKAAELAN
jgi:chemotaxis protein histidine kinase CheA